MPFALPKGNYRRENLRQRKEDAGIPRTTGGRRKKGGKDGLDLDRESSKNVLYLPVDFSAGS